MTLFFLVHISEISPDIVAEFEDCEPIFDELSDELQCPIHLGALKEPVVSKVIFSYIFHFIHFFFFSIPP